MTRIRIFILLCTVVCLAACSKGGRSGSGEEIGIYRMRTTPALPISCKIDSANLVLNLRPLISNNEILSYNQRDHQFSIEEAAAAKVRDVWDNETLAIVVGSEVVYYCINKPLYSSSACGNSISMQHVNGSTLDMALITFQPGTPIPDPRNDARLINSLRSQKKLR